MSRISLALLLLGIGPLSAAGQAVPDSGDVIVNEVMYAPSPSSNEYVELFNRSDRAVNLARLEYADANRDFSAVASADSLLDPGAYAVLVRDTTAFRDAFPSVGFLAPSGWEALNNGGDTVVLRDGPTGTVLDAVPYDPSWGGDDGTALERIDPDAPSNRAGNFGSSEAAAGGTPGSENSIFDPDETPPTLTSVSPTPDGDSLLARFSEPLDAATVAADAFSLNASGTPAIETASLSDTSAVQVVCGLDRSLSAGSFTLVASGVADPVGNVQSDTRASFRYFVPEVPQPSDLVITELLYAPPSASSEFIEVYNRSEKTVDLGTLEFADADREYDPLAPRLTAIEPDSHVVFVDDAAAFVATFPDVSFRAPDGWDALNNGGDTVYLRHAPSGTVIDSVPYTPSWGGSDGRSLERIDPAGPSDAASNFASSTAEAGATPGARNSQYNPDEAAPAPVFAEQTADRRIAITFSEPLAPASVRPDAFSLSAASVTAAQIRRDSVAALTLDDRPSGSTVQIEGVQDRVGNELTRAAAPLAYRPDSGDVVVNEILFDPRADDFDDRPNQVEYVEVLNRTERALSLRGLFVTDRPDERGVADTTRAGRRTALSPGGYGVVAATPDDAQSAEESQLARAFPQAPLAGDSVAFLPVDAQRLGLGNDGDLVRLHRDDGTPITDISYSPDWHAAGLEEPKGTALARISPTGGATGDNWTSSTAPTGGTPGQPNAVSLGPPPEASDRGLRIEPSPFSVERDGATRIRYTLDDVPNLVRAQIFDARGRKVRTLEDARLVGRTGELVWNGRDDEGNRVRIGVYIVLFEAVRAEEGTVARFKKPVVVARPLN
jgi:hypothetical protein